MPLRQPERQTGFALCQRFKSPKAASNLQFERPWDRLVPAKSVRKLTARIIVSKKFLGAERGCRVRYNTESHRILPLVSSGFPRVTKRTMMAMIMSAATAMPTLSGVIKLEPGVGVGVAEG